jgi:hypothetical protein
MRFYAQRSDRRARQLAADLGMVAWLLLWVIVARVVYRAVLVLGAPGRSLEDLGRSLSDDLGSAAGAASDIPLVGEDLADPLESLGGAGRAVAESGQGVQDAVQTLATVLAVVLVVLPVGWLLWRWLPWRLGWMREAAAAGRLATAGGTDDLELLAARAVATAPLPQLAALPPGTGAAWRAGDPDAVQALAGLELRRLGLAAPPADRSARSAGRAARPGAGSPPDSRSGAFPAGPLPPSTRGARTDGG